MNSIIKATYDHFVMDDSSDFSFNRKIAVFIDVTDAHDNNIKIFKDNKAMCTWGKIMDVLRPIKGVRYLIEFKALQGNFFQFPQYITELTGMQRKYKYDYKLRRLIHID